MKLKISITKLRKKYPHPLQALKSSGGYLDDYCVGGALCKEIGWTAIGFPNTQQIRDAIILANPNADYHILNDKTADWFYSETAKIEALNDIGKFDEAWKTLGKLLRWKPSKSDLNSFGRRA